MTPDISILQLVAYGVMGLFLLAAAFRVFCTLDCMRGLKHERNLARRLHRAVARGDSPDGKRDIDKVYNAAQKQPGTPLSGLVDDIRHAQRDTRSETILQRFGENLSRVIAPDLHRLNQLARVAGPLGLGFTTLVLTVSLLPLDPSAQDAHVGLLASLPLALVTTMIACFCVVPLRMTESRLLRIADELETEAQRIFTPVQGRR